MKGFKVITKTQWESLKSQCDFVDYLGECIHRGETYYEMQVMSDNGRGRVIYDYVLVDPKWN